MNGTAPRKRTIIYVDGFNLYYGAVKGTQYKWLNLQKFFTLLRPNDDIQVIRYFTAHITGSALSNQLTYLRALQTLPLVEIVLGKFKAKTVTCRVTRCAYKGSRRFVSQEEKRTDVNIALYMLDDANLSLCDRMVIVSGDSDLVPAVVTVKRRSPQIEMIVYVPARNAIRGAAVELRSSADKDRSLPLGLLQHAQFPVSLPDGHGGTICKPAAW